MKHFLATLFLPLCLLASARADVGPPPGKKSLPITTTVEATENFPDYAFFATSHSSTPGPPPHGGSSRSVTLHFFAPNTSIKAIGNRRSGGALYGVPRAAAEKMPGWSGFSADAAKHNPPKHATVSTSDDGWFALARSVKAGEVPGAISVQFGGSEDVPERDPRNAISENYRIVRTPAGVAFVRPGESSEESAGGVRDKCGNNGPESSTPWKLVAAGGAASLAFLLGGGLIVWRIARRA